MRILIIHNKYIDAGGEDSVVKNEIQLLKQNLHEVEVLYFKNNATTPKALFHYLFFFFNLNSFFVVLRRILVFRPDVVHIHNFFYTASPSIFVISKLLVKKVVLTIHNYRLICLGTYLYRKQDICELCVVNKNLFRGVRNKCFQNSYFKSTYLAIVLTFYNKISFWNIVVDKFVFLTEFQKNKFLSSGIKIDTSKICIKPNFINQQFDNILLQRNQRIVFVGRLTEEKGSELLIELIKLDTFAIDIFGDGEYRGRIEEACNCSKLSKYHGLQEVSYINQVMRKSSLLLFLSKWYEGFPMVLVEAFSSGLPIVSNDIDNINSIIKSGYNGFVFKKNDLNDCIKKINMVLDFASKSMIRNSLHTFETYYSSEINYKRLIDLYNVDIGLID
jgi:glycosyltransferase involved in cell wall biosynthesis